MFPVLLMRLVSYFMGFLYPCYMTFKALETTDKEDDKQWLMYWMVFSIMNFMEVFEFLFAWFPLFYELKLAFIVWLVVPQTKGALKMYSQFLQPFLQQHEADFDRYIQQGKTIAAKTYDQVTTQVKDKLGQVSGGSRATPPVEKHD